MPLFQFPQFYSVVYCWIHTLSTALSKYYFGNIFHMHLNNLCSKKKPCWRFIGIVLIQVNVEKIKIFTKFHLVVSHFSQTLVIFFICVSHILQSFSISDCCCKLDFFGRYICFSVNLHCKQLPYFLIFLFYYFYFITS